LKGKKMSVLDKLGNWLNLDQYSTMLKSESGPISTTPANTPVPEESLIGQRALLVDPLMDQNRTSAFALNKASKISHRSIREIVRKDFLVKTILQIRADTVVRFSRPLSGERNRFEMGFKFCKRDSSTILSKEDQEVIKGLEQFILTCGKTDQVPPGQEMGFGDFLKMLTFDALTYGHIGVEKVLTRGGALHRFRPLPSESLYLVAPTIAKEVLDESGDRALKEYKRKRSSNDYRNIGDVNEVDTAYAKYTQVGDDGRVLSVFGDEDLAWALFNPKNTLNSNGYATSLVEDAIYLIASHINTETFNSNIFTHGYASRGILHLKGPFNQNQLSSFRRQFDQTISGSNNAWRTPIVAGLDEVQYISLQGQGRDAEYLNYNSHIMRSICTAFQIDPLELGMDYLVSANGRAAGNKESGQFKITYSRERGLVPLLMFLEDFINCKIIKALDQELHEKYIFKFFGYTDETAQTDVNLRQAQMTTFASMNFLLKNEEMPELQIPLNVADLPLNQTFWNLVERNMTRGEIREIFLGDKGAKDRKELQYIPGDPAFLQWQQMLMQVAQSVGQSQAQAPAPEEGVSQQGSAQDPDQSNPSESNIS
jgi:hypothetical protein